MRTTRSRRGARRIPAARRQLLAAGALAALSAACGEPEIPRPVAAPVSWRAPASPLVRPEPALVRRLEVPAEIEPWRVLRGEGRVSPLSADPRVLRLLERENGRGRPRQVRIDGPFEAGEFDTLRLFFRALIPVHIQAVFLRDGEGVASTVAIATSGRELTAVELDIPAAAREQAPFDELQLSLTALTPWIDLGPIELLSVPRLSRVPLLPDAPVLSEIAGDWRVAIGLVAGLPVTADLVIPPGTRALRFSAGAPESLLGGADVRLRARLAPGGGGAVEREFTLPDAPGWNELELPLEGVAAGPATISLELDGGADAGAVRLVEEPRPAREAGPHPTVVLVTSDTHRADHVRALGLGVDVDTPALDALASRGVLFTDCLSTTNVTIPSHTAMLTAVSPRDTGVIDNILRLDEGVTTLAKVFRAGGFRAVAVTSVDLLAPRRSGLGQGFQRFSVPALGERAAADSVALALAEIERSSGEALFLWLHLFDAHAPQTPAQDLRERYWGERRNPFDPRLPPSGVPDERLPGPLRGIRDLEWPRAMYRAEVSGLDRELVRLFDHPRVRAGAIAVTADHGESLGGHGLWLDHAGLYPSTLHVPLLLAWPGGPAGLRVEREVSTIDLGRTLLDLAGLGEAAFGGTSLLSQLEDGAPAGPRFTLSSAAKSASVTLEGWHLILHLEDRGADFDRPHRRHEIELYDLRTDRACERDLAATEPGRAAHLRGLLVDWLAAASPHKSALSGVTDARDLAQLAYLGYATEGRQADAGAWIDPDCTCPRCVAFAE